MLRATKSFFFAAQLSVCLLRSHFVLNDDNYFYKLIFSTMLVHFPLSLVVIVSLPYILLVMHRIIFLSVPADVITDVCFRTT